ncbi:M12 family metallo-peptidase [Balneola sp. MJW-20]|uniref:M12 family metallo-peptidase n=1 Tax=Gracilimonas aurantiaca TaxID=3234185 RepID=UPI00346589ED
MKRVLAIATLSSLMLLWSVNLFAQNARIQINTLTESRAKTLADGVNSWDYSLNGEFNSSELEVGDELSVQLPGGMRNLEVIRKSNYLEGTTSFAARELEDNGKVFSFTINQGVMIGLYHNEIDESLVFAYDSDRNQPLITESEYFSALGCDLEQDFLDPATLTESNFKVKGNGETTAFSNPTTAMSMLTSVEDSITIDLMIPYTAAAKRAASRNISLFSIESVIAQAMNLAQTALDGSETAIKLRLVHTYETDYDETTDGVGSGDRLRRLTSAPTYTPPFLAEHAGYMEEVHEFRDQYGADLVALFADVNDTGGIAWVLGDPYGFAPLGFSLNRVLQVSTGYTMIHEIGHNMGNLHSRTQQTQSAGARGGLFHYSVGFQNRNDSVHTIMAYSEGLNRVPVFSTPDRNYNGARIGSDSPFTPADNSRSMREIKRTMASYRPTTTDPPEFTASTDAITVQLRPGSQITVPIQLSNSGASDLMWEMDFAFSDTPIVSNSRSKGSYVEPALKQELLRNNGSSQSQKLVNLSDSVFFETSFEGDENYSTGNGLAINAWEVISTGDPVATISNLNPATGGQHLRINNSNSGDPLYLRSPFLGPLPFAKYKIDFSFSFSVADSVNEVFEFYLNDRRRSEYSSGIRVSNNGNDVLAIGRNEFGVGVFFSTGVTLQEDVYHDVSIVHNTDSQKLEYYLNGELIASNEYTDGFTPEELILGSSNTNAGASLDLDDFSVTILDFPFSYLNADKVAGVITPGQSETISFEVDASDLELGFYNTTMTVYTNDAGNTELSVPLQIEVTENVSNESGSGDLPDEITLAQNFPNPFNPTTQISYSINEPQRVSIDVFDIQGRKVATLFDGFRNSGRYTATFDASGLASGVYIYRLMTPANVITRRMVLIK